MTRDEAAARNRARFPVSAAFVDEMREAFGPGVKLVYASENGQVIGEPVLHSVQPVLEYRRKEGGRGC